MYVWLQGPSLALVTMGTVTLSNQFLISCCFLHLVFIKYKENWGLCVARSIYKILILTQNR